MPTHPVAEEHQDRRVFDDFLGGRYRQKPSAAKSADKQASTPQQIPTIRAAIALAAASTKVVDKLVQRMLVESRGRYALSLRPIEQVLRGSDVPPCSDQGEP
jgi:hypothetical protein